MRTAVVILVLLAGSPAFCGPGEAVADSLRDLRAQPAELRPFLRYLDAQAVPEAARADLDKALRFWVNSLSREPDLVPPVKVSPTLYRVNILDYRWKAATWEKLAEADPYFHVQIETLKAEEWGYWSTNAYGQRSWVTTETRKAKVRQAAAAPWLPTREIGELITLTQSQAPVVRADWFMVQTAQQEGRKGTGYYDFLALGNAEKDFQNLIGADAKRAKELRKEIAGVVGKSSVTLNNRGLVRLGTINGGYWFSQDYETSIDRQNSLRLLDGDTEPPAGDASEQYGVLPNGLFTFWLQNAQGVRQNTAPDKIASDKKSPSTDSRVHVGISCVRCHAEGLRPIDDWARKVYRHPLKLAAVDYEKFKRLRQLYLSDLEGQLKRDIADYTAALKTANGLTPALNAQTFARVWERYQEEELSVDDVAREAGITPEKFLGALKTYAASSGVADPVLVGLLARPPAAIRREHIEELQPVIWSVLGYGVPSRQPSKTQTSR